MIKVNTENFNDVINSSKYVVIDVWETWCGPCKTYGPVFEKVAEENTNSDVVYAKLQLSDAQDIASKIVRSIPTTLFYKNGELISKKTGILTPEAIQNELNSAEAGDEIIRENSTYTDPNTSFTDGLDTDF